MESMASWGEPRFRGGRVVAHLFQPKSNKNGHPRGNYICICIYIYISDNFMEVDDAGFTQNSSTVYPMNPMFQKMSIASS